MRPHGTSTRYVTGCRCDECRQAIRATESRHRRKIALHRWGAGPPTYVDAEPARAHVRALMAAGMGWQRVARTAGVSTGCVERLIYGRTDRPPSARIRPDTARRILAVHAEPASGALVDATGSVRRVRALMVLGWSQSQLARHLGMQPLSVSQLLRRQTIRRATADRVRGVYDDLWDKPPPCDTPQARTAAARARRYAAVRGWAPPAAWDDDRIDDPRGRPIGVVRATQTA